MPTLTVARVRGLSVVMTLTLLLLATFCMLAHAEGTLPAFDSIDHVTLNVPDLAKSVAWYKAILGFESVLQTPRYVMLKRGSATLVLNRSTSTASRADPETSPGYFHVAFTVRPGQFRSSVESLRARGTSVEAVSDIDHQNAYFKDPDGNTLELMANAPNGQQDPASAVFWVADVVLDHLEATDYFVRTQLKLPLDRLSDFSFEGAQQQALFSRQMLERLNQIDSRDLPHDRQLLASILRQTLQVGSTADRDYWYQFLVTPYSGGMTLQQIHNDIATTPLTSAADRDRFLNLLNQYAAMVAAIRSKTLAQADRGIRVSQQALPGVTRTINGLRESMESLCEALVQKVDNGSINDPSAASFKARVHDALINKILPAYHSLQAIFDARYAKVAPSDVGLRTYVGGKEDYQRRIFAETGLNLQPAFIYAIGMKRVKELEGKLAGIRERVGFKGDKHAFHAMLRSDPRFLAKTPGEVKARYLEHMSRIAPLMPKYFLVLPQAPYGVERLDPAAEAGMTYGYYSPPTIGQPLGIYFFNGSKLDQRSLVTSAHLIYHELLPGHHLRLALASENKTQHPLLSVLSFGAYEEGWAEYAADLAIEMGAMPDFYDQYGHYVLQEFGACRLVVDTGMNYLGWSRAKAQRFMVDHSFESDAQIATETLRYSTDIPAQAVDYRLGYETLTEGRKRAEKALGSKFDIRSFNTAVSNNGAMPLNVLDQQIDWFIAQQ